MVSKRMAGFDVSESQIAGRQIDTDTAANSDRNLSTGCIAIGIRDKITEIGFAGEVQTDTVFISDPKVGEGYRKARPEV